ncbi:MAG: precorrin-2 dehydrogenase [Campylobacterota bacterium]|nr:precorrin-2 dehydrogenase [Campylobacterota bacterium]
MSYFPAFLKLDSKKVLLIGGGNIAYEKLRHLLDFTSDITVIALEFSPNMQKLMEEKSIAFEKRGYSSGDIKNYAIVVIAIDDIALQAQIFKESRAYNCLCNAVDSLDYCDFTFGSYIKKDDLLIAISTSGSSPALAKQLKNYLQNLLPPNIGDFLKEMKNLRESLPKGKERMQYLSDKVKEYMQSWK